MEVQTNVVKRFEHSHSSGDVEEMRQCAQTLLPFGKVR